jgi:hypothetical protein
MAAQLLQHRRLQLSRWHAGQGRCTGVLFDVALGHVVPVAATVLFGEHPEYLKALSSYVWQHRVIAKRGVLTQTPEGTSVIAFDHDL